MAKSKGYIKVSFKRVEITSKEIQQRLDDVYEIIFEEVLKKRSYKN